MLTDVAGAAMERYAGRSGRVAGRPRMAAESRGDIVFGHKTLNSNLSNFIPADRCLAGQNIRAGGGGEREDDLREGGRGSKRVTPPFPRLHSPSSTDLETIDFIPAFAPGEGEAVSDYRRGRGGRGGWWRRGGTKT